MMHAVLIVDDEALVRCSVRHMLEQKCADHYMVSEAENGRKALEALRKAHFDIMITDIKMPGMDGLALLQRLSEEHERPATIILSGYPDFTYAQQGMHYGVREYILKPVKQQDLDRALAACVRDLPPPNVDAASSPRNVIAYLDASFTGPLSLDGLATRFGFSAKHLAAMIKVETGKNFTEYIQDLRIKKSVELLMGTDMQIKRVAMESGYDDLQYFHRVFKQKMGLTPKQYRTIANRNPSGDF